MESKYNGAVFNTYLKMQTDDFYVIGAEDPRTGVTVEVTVPGKADQEEVDGIEKNFVLRILFDIIVAVKCHRRYGK